LIFNENKQLAHDKHPKKRLDFPNHQTYKTTLTIQRPLVFKKDKEISNQDFGDFNKEKKLRDTVNCYAYALNLKRHPFTRDHFSELTDSGFGLQPGSLMKPIRPGVVMCPLRNPRNITAFKLIEYISKDVEALGGKILPADLDTLIPQDGRKIALVVHPFKDYHFYRQDTDGTWSHKLATKPVTNLDCEGNLIFDPKKAARNYKDANYEDFAGYFILMGI
jgi:hypothetical protein